MTESKLTNIFAGIFILGLAVIAVGLSLTPYKDAPLIEISNTNTEVDDIPESPATSNMVELDLRDNFESLMTQDNIEIITEDNQEAVISATTEKLLIRVERGDNFITILRKKVGIDRPQAAEIIRTLKQVFDIRSLRAGQELSIALEQTADGDKYVKALRFQPTRTEIIEVIENQDGDYVARKSAEPLTNIDKRVKGSIATSLYSDALKAGATPTVISNLLHELSYKIDFQRDIRKGDEFEILFAAKTDKTGKIVESGVIKYARLNTRGEDVRIYRYKHKDKWEYFDAKGQSVKRLLLKTPIDGARVSSGFGKRLHPILGYTKMHAGVDFAAPTGTPIYAAGDGEVTRIGWVSGYGKYIKIKHNSTYSSAYAHMSRFAKNVEKGTRVQQGQIISYVGSTGRSTGPHLHYEVIKNGKKINPARSDLPVTNKLFLKDKEKFDKLKQELEG